MGAYRREEDEWMVSNYDKQVDIGREYFLKYDQEFLVEKFHLEMDEQYIYLTYIGTPCRIDRETAAVYEKNSDIYVECRSYETVMTIYDMLCHGDSPTLPPLSGKWTLVGNFAAAGSSPDANLFAQKYADAFSGKTDALKDACTTIGGEILDSIAGADVTARIPVFSFVPVLLQYWEKDEEFPPQVRLLWDDQSMKYLNFETTYYLQGDLLERLLQLIR